MNFNEAPVGATPGRLRFSSRRVGALRKSAVDIRAASAGARQTTDASPLAVVGEAIASLYVAIARRVLIGIEAIEDRRAESRPGAFSDPSASIRAPNPEAASASSARSSEK